MIEGNWKSGKKRDSSVFEYLIRDMNIFMGLGLVGFLVF